MLLFTPDVSYAASRSQIAATLVPLASLILYPTFTEDSPFICTVMSSCAISSIRPFNWTAVLVPVDKSGGGIDLLTESMTPLQ